MKPFAVCTLTVGDFYDKLAVASHPTLEAYAEKCGADFVVRRFLTTEIAAYSKLDLIRRLLNHYERVLFVDTDILIRHDAPNLFDLVLPEYFAAFNEGDLFPERMDAKALWTKESGTELNKAWLADKIYFNTGVMLVSRCHAEIFADPEKPINNFGEQTFLNHQIFVSGTKVYCLPYRFNRLTVTLRQTGEPLDDSYFVHFAGAFDQTENGIRNYKAWLECTERFKSYKLKNDVPTFRRRLYIETDGALGDVVSTEPVVRYIRRELEPDADITIKTFWPEVFAHLKADPYTTILGPKDTAPDKGHKIIKLMPKAPIANFNLMHPLDFAALAAFRGHLPDAHRKIELSVTEKSPVDTSEMLLVHPGKSWQSKTFPLAWWQAIIDGLKMDVEVAIIGRSYEDDDGRGTVDVDATDCVDLRNKTTLPQLIAAISQAGALVSNDSSPVHIAGAFRTPVVMITSAKHPDFIWPHRNPWLNITLGRPIKAAAPAIGRVNNTYIHECSDEELQSVLPEPEIVIKRALQAWRQRRRGFSGHHSRNYKSTSPRGVGLRRSAENANRS